MTEQQLREEMVQIGASLFSRGYATGSAGNLSLLLPDGNLLATPTGACLGELQAQRLSVVTLQGEWISGDKPSKEVTFHRAVYLHNPACKAIVHLHSHYLTALSCLQGLDPHNCIRPFTPYVVMRVGDVPVVPYYRPGDDRIAQALAGLAPRYNAFFTGQPRTGGYWLVAARSHQQYRGTGRDRTADIYPRQPRDPLPDR